MFLTKLLFLSSAFFATGSSVAPTKINIAAMNHPAERSSYEPSWIEKKIINKLYDEFGRPLDRHCEHYDPNKSIYPE